MKTFNFLVTNIFGKSEIIEVNAETINEALFRLKKFSRDIISINIIS